MGVASSRPLPVEVKYYGPVRLLQAETEIYIGGDVPICVECSDAQQAAGRKPPGVEHQLRAALLQDILDATARNSEATREFEAVMGHFPSGLPHPDGAQRIKNASNHLSIARKEVMKAHKRLDDFLNRGVVPDALKHGSGR
jgi:hypothetical protein